MKKMAKENKNHSQFLLFICERKSHKCSLSSWLWVARTVAILVKRNITCDINICTFTICMYQTHKTQRIQTLNEQLWIYLVVTNGECVKTIENGIELKCGYFCCCWFFFSLFCFLYSPLARWNDFVDRREDGDVWLSACIRLSDSMKSYINFIFSECK